MLLSYLRAALYYLRKQPVMSAIKVLSLTLGLACSILVVLHVQYVQSSNKHIDNWRNTYRLITHLKNLETNTPYRTARTGEPFAPQLKLDYGDQIQYIAKIHQYENGMFNREATDGALNSYSFAEADAVHILDL
jgi:putative ABC transport system permease protein